jgi:transposase
MAGRRVDTDRLRELIRLRRSGTSARGITRALRMGACTERRYRALLARAGLLDGPAHELPTLEVVRAAVDAVLPRPGARAQPSSVAPWLPRIEELFDKGVSARATFDRLRLEAHGEAGPFRGSYSAIKRAYRQLRRARGVQKDDVAIPVETAPGECAQVDFGYAGKLFDLKRGELRRAWVFVMVLCHSRHMFVRLVWDQRTETWLDLHRQAFEAFGGSVAVLVPDNTRRAVLRAAWGIDGPAELERSYRELARHYGCRIEPSPPGAPWTKGKAEAAVKFVKRNALAGRDGERFDDVQAVLTRWNREVASVRLHGGTGRRPVEVFGRDERPALRPLPSRPCEMTIWKRAKVHPDGHVAFREQLFSVPWRLTGEAVWLRACGRRLEAFHDDRRVAVHDRSSRRRTTLDEHLPADRHELRHRGRAHWEDRAARIGPETSCLVRQLFEACTSVSNLRCVQATVTLLSRHDPRRAEEASRQARRSAAPTYSAVKRALLETTWQTLR